MRPLAAGRRHVQEQHQQTARRFEVAQTGAEEGDKKGMGGGREKKSRSPPAPRRTPPGSCSCLSPGGPRTKPRCPGTGSVPCSLPRTAQLFFFPFSPSPSAGCPVRKASILSIRFPANKQTKEPRLVPEINKLGMGRLVVGEVWKRRERFKMFIYFVSCCKI